MVWAKVGGGDRQGAGGGEDAGFLGECVLGCRWQLL